MHAFLLLFIITHNTLTHNVSHFIKCWADLSTWIRSISAISSVTNKQTNKSNLYSFYFSISSSSSNRKQILSLYLEMSVYWLCMCECFSVHRTKKSWNMTSVVERVSIFQCSQNFQHFFPTPRSLSEETNVHYSEIDSDGSFIPLYWRLCLSITPSTTTFVSYFVVVFHVHSFHVRLNFDAVCSFRS